MKQAAKSFGKLLQAAPSLINIVHLSHFSNILIKVKKRSRYAPNK